MTKLSANHQRHVLSTFRYLDQVLDEAERIMSSSRCAFPRYVADLRPGQAEVLAMRFVEFRAALAKWVSALGIAAGGGEVSAVHALRVYFVAAEVTLEDLNAASLRGYGAVSGAALETLTVAATDLRRLLRRMTAVLDDDLDLAAASGQAPREEE